MTVAVLQGEGLSMAGITRHVEVPGVAGGHGGGVGGGEGGGGRDENTET